MPAQHFPTTTATQAVPVQVPMRGWLTAIFFTAGERVKRGQLLAKMMRADAGGPAYLLAPAAGRIGPAQQQVGESVAAHATLAVIEIALTR
jgi:biotin carboxyl carrier protein